MCVGESIAQMFDTSRQPGYLLELSTELTLPVTNDLRKHFIYSYEEPVYSSTLSSHSLINRFTVRDFSSNMCPARSRTT